MDGETGRHKTEVYNLAFEGRIGDTMTVLFQLAVSALRIANQIAQI